VAAVGADPGHVEIVREQAVGQVNDPSGHQSRAVRTVPRRYIRICRAFSRRMVQGVRFRGSVIISPLNLPLAARTPAWSAPAPRRGTPPAGPGRRRRRTGGRAEALQPKAPCQSRPAISEAGRPSGRRRHCTGVGGAAPLRRHQVGDQGLGGPLGGGVVDPYRTNSVHTCQPVCDRAKPR